MWCAGFYIFFTIVVDMLDEIGCYAKEGMQQKLEVLDTALKRIRTGRVHPSLLDVITVDYCGSMIPLNQLASITTEDSRTLVVNVWDKSSIPTVAKAIIKSDLDLNPIVADTVIRVSVPPLTEENRKQLVKNAKAEAEKVRTAIRHVRREAMDMLKDDSLSKDDKHQGQGKIQDFTDEYIGIVDVKLEEKKKQLMST